MPKRYPDIIWTPRCRDSRLPKPAVTGAEIDYNTPAAVRGIDMLLAKYHGRGFESEVYIASPQSIPVAKLSKALKEAKIALVTDGGLVPAGNPDGQPPVAADKFRLYRFKGKKRLSPEDYEVSHQGYYNKFVLEDPNRLVPLDAARTAEAGGRIGALLEAFYSTAGVMQSVEKSREMGQGIACSLRHNGVDGVILTSTCGTSTRCGAYMACEIENAGIPVVHVTNLTQISEGVGCSRILKGSNISHVFGNPDIPPEQEAEWRKRLFDRALALLEEVPDEDACLIVN